MKPETLQLLQSADDPINCEFPPGFKWHLAMYRVGLVKSKVEEIVGRTFVMDEHVQDAAFFTDLSICVPSTSPNYPGMNTVIAIRFSNFGDMFTIWNNAVEKLSDSVIQRIIEAVRSEGFHFVESESLTEKYTEDNPVFQGQTWWDRFFDYG